MMNAMNRGKGPHPAAPGFRPAGAVWAPCAVIVLAGLAAYHNSFGGVFVFDDFKAIAENASIRRLWPPGPALWPPPDGGNSGRPLANLSFALNYALSGLNVWSYHAFNLAVHIGAGLALFGVAKRTLLQPALRPQFGDEAPLLALAIATLWTVHPVQTEAVTFLAQRVESLMGLFYLVTLYCFIRGSESGKTASRWLAASIGACLCGMTVKETMATAPMMVLLYDRTFVAGSLGEAWRRRRGYYAALAATWIFLALLMANAQLNKRSIGFGTGLSPLGYAMTECRAILLYLRLAVWPHPLIFDYGGDFIWKGAEAVPYALMLGALVAGTCFAVVRRPALGFAGCWFFGILAPSSSVIPLVGQPIAEHRLYLSLAAVVALAVTGLHAWIGRRALVVWLIVAFGFGWMAVRRNALYGNSVALMADTVAKRPQNGRAQTNLGEALMEAGRLEEAIPHFETALRLKTAHAEIACCDLGEALLRLGRSTEAIEPLEIALRIDPDYAEAHDDLGAALMEAGRRGAAMEEFRTALRLKPDSVEARKNIELLKKAREAPLTP